MGKNVSAIFGALVYSTTIFSGAWADSLAMALPAPLPRIAAPLPDLPGLHPTMLEHPSGATHRMTGAGVQDIVKEQADINAFGFPCTATMRVIPADNAMLNVTISVPCKPNHVVALTFEGLSIDLTLSMTGEARIEIPALAYENTIDVVIDKQTSLSATATTPDLGSFVRVALGWSDASSPTLGGKAPRHLPIDVTTLGDGTGRIAQVLSHHVDPEARKGVIRLGMTLPVTLKNCATAQSGHVVQYLPGLPQLRYGLTLAPAGCDQVGRNLELKNILQDLKLASN